MIYGQDYIVWAQLAVQCKGHKDKEWGGCKHIKYRRYWNVQKAEQDVKKSGRLRRLKNKK